MTINLGSAVLTLAADSSQMSQALRQAEDQINGWGDRLQSTMAGAGSSIQRVGEVAMGMLVAQAIPALINGFKNVASEAIGVTANLQQMQIGVEGLLAREIAKGDEVIKTRQVRVQLTEKEREKLQDLGLQRDKLNAQLQEETERHRQLTAKWGAEGLAVKTHAASMAILKDKLEDTNASITKLQGKQGGLTTVTEKMRVNTMSLAEAMPLAQDKAKKMMDELARIAILSPYQLENVNNTFKQAMAFGYGADEATTFTKAILNVAAGVGAGSEQMDRMAYNLAQIRMVGKVSAVDVRQLAMAGFDLNGVLEYAGEKFKVAINSYDDFNKALASGRITWAQFTAAFAEYADKNFGGASERMARSLAGLQATFKDLFALTMPQVVGPALESVTGRLSKVLDLFLGIRESGALEAFGRALGSFAERALAPLDRVLTYIEQIKQQSSVSELGVAGAARSATAPPADALGGALQAAFGPGVLGPLQQVRGALDMIAGAFTAVRNAVTTAWQALQPFVAGFLSQIGQFVQLKDVVAAFGIILATAAVPALVAAAGALLAFAAPIAAVVAGVALLRTAWERDWGGIQEKTATALAAVRTGIGELANAFQTGGLPAVGQLLGTWWQGVVSYVTTNAPQWGQQIAAQVGVLWAGLVDWWQTDGQQLVGQIGAALDTWWQGVVSYVTTNAPQWGQQIAGAMAQVWAKLTTFDTGTSTGQTGFGKFVAQIQDLVARIQLLIQPLADFFGPTLQRIGEAVQGLTPQFSDMKTKFDALGQALTPVIDALGRVLGPVLAGLAGAVAGVVKIVGEGLAQAFERIGPLIGLIVDGVTNFFNVLTGRTSIIDGFINEIKAVLGVLDNLAGGLWDTIVNTLNDVFDAALPSWDEFKAQVSAKIAEIGAAISAFVQPIGAAIKGISDFFAPTVERIGQALSGIGPQFTALKTSLDALFQAVRPIGDFIGNVLAKAIEIIKARFEEWWQSIQPLVNILGTVLAGAVETIKSALEGLWKIVEGGLAVLGLLVKLVGEGLAQGVEHIVPILSLLVDGVTNFFNVLTGKTSILEGFGNSITIVLGILDNFVSMIWDALVNTINDAFGTALPSWEQFKTDVVAVVTGLVTGLTEKTEEIWGAIKGWFEEAVKKAKEFLGIESPSTVFYSIAVDLAQGLIDGVASMIEAVGKKIGEVKDAIIKVFDRPLEVLSTIGQNIIDGLFSGITTAWGRMIEGFTGLIALLPASVKRILGISSPSTVFAELGVQTMAGLAVGFEAGAAQATEALLGSLEGVLQALANWANAQASLNQNANIASAKAISEPLAEIIDNVTQIVEGLETIGQTRIPTGLAAAVQRMTAEVEPAIDALSNFAGYLVRAGKNPNIASAKAVTDPLTDVMGNLSDIAAGLDDLNALRDVPIDLTPKMQLITRALEVITDTLAQLGRELAGVDVGLALAVADTLSRITAPFSDVTSALGAIYDIWNTVDARWRTVTPGSLTGAAEDTPWQRALNWLKATMRALARGVAVLYADIGDLPPALVRFADELSELLAPFSAAADALGALFAVWTQTSRQFHALTLGSRTGETEDTDWQRALNWIKAALRAVQTGLARVMELTGPISRELVDFASRLVGLLAPFSAMLKFWDELRNAVAGPRFGPELRQKLNELLYSYQDVLLVLYNAIENQQTALFRTDMLTEQLKTFAAELGGLLAPFSAMLDFWDRLGAMASANVPDLVPKLQQLADTLAQAALALLYILRAPDKESGYLTQEEVSLAAMFAEAAGQVVSFVGQAITAFDALAQWTPTAEVWDLASRLQRLAGFVGQLVLALDWVAQFVTRELQDAAKALAENAGPVLALVKTGVEAFDALAQWTPTAEVWDLAPRLQRLAGFVGQLVLALDWVAQFVTRELQDVARTFAENVAPVVNLVNTGLDALAKLGSTKLSRNLAAQFSLFTAAWGDILTQLAGLSKDTRALADEELTKFARAVGEIGAGLANALSLLTDLSVWKRARDLPDLIQRFVSDLDTLFTELQPFLSRWTAQSTTLATAIGNALSAVMIGLKAALDLALAIPASWQRPEPSLWDDFFAWSQGVFEGFIVQVNQWVEDEILSDPGFVSQVAQAFSAVMSALKAALDLALAIPADWTSPPAAVWDDFFTWTLATFEEFARRVQEWVRTELVGTPEQATFVGTVADAFASVFDALKAALDLTLADWRNVRPPDIEGQMRDFIDWAERVFEAVAAYVRTTWPTGTTETFEPVTSFSNAMGSVFGGLKNALEVFVGLQSYIPVLAGRIEAFLTGATYAYGLVQTYATGPGIQAATEAVRVFAEAADTVFSGLYNALKLYQELAESTPADWGTFAYKITALIDRISESIDQFVAASEVAPEWTQAAQDFYKSLTDVIGVLNNALSLFQNLQDKGLPSPTTLQAFLDAVLALFANVVSGLVQTGVDMRSTFREIAGLLGANTDDVTRIGRALADAFLTALADGLRAGVNAIANAIYGLLSGVASSGVSSAARTLGTTLAAAIVDGIVAGLAAGRAAVAAAAAALAAATETAAKTELAVASPSQRMIDLFRQVPAGAALGIRAGLSDVAEAMGEIAEVVDPGATNLFGRPAVQVQAERRIVIEFRGAGTNQAAPIPLMQFEQLKRELAYAIQLGA